MTTPSGKHNGIAFIFFRALILPIFFLGCLFTPGDTFNTALAAPEAAATAVNQGNQGNPQANPEAETIAKTTAKRLVASVENQQLSPDQIQKNLIEAIELAPEYAFPELAFSRFLFFHFKPFASLRHLLTGFQKAGRNSAESFALRAFIRFIPALILPFLTGALILVLGLRYFRAFMEIAAINLKYYREWQLLAGSLLAALIILFMPAPIFGLLFFAALLSLAATRRDLTALALLTLSLLIVPPAWNQGMIALLAAAPPAEIQENNPDITVVKLFKASQEARENGNLKLAIEQLRMIISLRTNAGAPYNNLANLLQLTRQPAEVIELYEMAAERLPNNGIPYYNLSQALIKNSFDLDRSHQALEKALALNPELNLIATPETSGQGQIFLPLPQSFQLAAAAQREELPVLRCQFFSQFCLPAENLLVYSGLIMLFLVFFSYRLYSTPPDRKICNRCGRLFHTLSYRQKHSRRFCRSCGQASSTPPLDRLINSLANLLGPVIPGSFQLFHGRPVSSILLMVPTTFWLYYLIFPLEEISGLNADPWLSWLLPVIIWPLNLALYKRLYRQVNRKKLEIIR